ncbi:MAG: aspartate kinase [Planctomycetes bacterium]|nr:aspartate kinase [Planctomycetota bacterium]
MLLIQKFGGTSVGDGDRIGAVAGIVKATSLRGHRVAVVVSATGDTTDHLLDACRLARRGDAAGVSSVVEAISAAHRVAVARAMRPGAVQESAIEVVEALLRDLARILGGLAAIGEVTPRSQDAVVAFGERLSAPILAAALNDRGCKARPFTGAEAGICTDSTFGEARPLMDVTRHQVRLALGAVLDGGLVPVVTGFIAADSHGVTTTLGRSGSDYTATLLGACLSADEVEIYSDVDGLMTADPRIVPDARVIPELGFAEAEEMAFFGAKMMHPMALETANEAGVVVRIRGTFKPEFAGTRIVPNAARGRVPASTMQERSIVGQEAPRDPQSRADGDRPVPAPTDRPGFAAASATPLLPPSFDPQPVVRAVSLIRNVGLITVSGAGMAGLPGTAARVFDVLGKQRANVLMVSQGSSEVNISIVIPAASVPGAVNALELALLGGEAVHDIQCEEEVSVVAAVGAGMRGTTGVAARIFGAVAEAGVNVRMIAQGSSELNVSFVVSSAQAPAAVKALHAAFGLGD